MSKHTIASLSALVMELTTRLTTMEARIVELETVKVIPAVKTQKKQKKQKEIAADEVVSSDTESKKLPNPTGPAAFNAYKTKFIQEHPDVPKDKQLYEATIAYRMEKDNLTREAAEEQFASAKAKRSSKSKKETVVEPVVEPVVRTADSSTYSSNASVKMPWELDTSTTNQMFDDEVREKLDAVKREIDGHTYYISKTNTCFIFKDFTIDSALAVGTYNEKKNTVRLNKDGKSHFA